MNCSVSSVMKINLTTNIRTNTRKFSSVDELPPDIREAYERALATGPGKLTASDPKVVARLVVNGHEVELPKQLSEVEQKLVSDVMQLLKNSGATVHTPETPTPSTPVPGPTHPSAETGWLTKKQKQLIMVAIALAVLAVVVLLARG